MGNFHSWQEFIESKDKPPQGKGAAPYHGAHAKNDGKVMLKVAEKSSATALGDEATPSLRDPKHNHPLGIKPKKNAGLKAVHESRLSKDEPDGKVKLRVAEKSKEEPLGDKTCHCMSDRKKVMPYGEKPKKQPVTTEQFLKATETMTDAEFIQALLGEDDDSHKSDDDDGDDDEEDDEAGEDLDFGEFLKSLLGKPSRSMTHDPHDDEEEELSPCGGEEEGPDMPLYDLVRHLTKTLPKNKVAVRMFVHELEQQPESLSALMGEMVQHGSLYGEMVNQIGLGETKVARRFAEAMQDGYMESLGINEAVGQPLGSRFKKKSHRQPQPQQPPQPAATAQDAGAAAQPEGMPGPQGGMMGSELGAAPPMSQGGMQDDPFADPSQPPMPAGKPQGPPAMQQQMAAANQEYSYHHMIKEMSKFDNMVEAMNSVLGD